MNWTSTSTLDHVSDQQNTQNISFENMTNAELQKRFYELFKKNDPESKKEMDLIYAELQKRDSNKKEDSNKNLSDKMAELLQKMTEAEKNGNNALVNKLLEDYEELRKQTKEVQRKKVSTKNTKDLQKKNKDKNIGSSRIEDLKTRLNEMENENNKLKEDNKMLQEVLYLPLSRRRERKKLVTRYKGIESLQNNPEEAVVYIMTMTRKLYGGKVTQSIKKFGMQVDSAIQRAFNFSGKVGNEINKNTAMNDIKEIIKKLEPTSDEQTKPELGLIKVGKENLQKIIKDTWNKFLEQGVAKYKIA